MPMHYDHYNILSAVLEKDDIYVHDEAALLMDHYMIKEFNREFSSVKENSRLNQAGLPKVVFSTLSRQMSSFCAAKLFIKMILTLTSIISRENIKHISALSSV